MEPPYRNLIEAPKKLWETLARSFIRPGDQAQALPIGPKGGFRV